MNHLQIIEPDQSESKTYVTCSKLHKGKKIKQRLRLQLRLLLLKLSQFFSFHFFFGGMKVEQFSHCSTFILLFMSSVVESVSTGIK
jgi:hypothetical protein